MKEVILPIERIEYFIQFEPFAVLVSAFLLAFVFYKLFLKKISAKRHANLKERFIKTLFYLCIAVSVSSIHWWMVEASWSDYHSLKIANYIGLIGFIIAVSVVIRLAQIYVYLYLFLANMSQGVPRLLANLFTLLFSTFVISWLASDVFGFHIATVLATSAIFTIVLGLALQDTLGNLFSGVALQIENPFVIGDWVEIHNSTEKWVGQIHEVTWRATSLVGFGDELIVIPNKTIAQSQLTIFSPTHRPARFNHLFRFKLDTPIEKARAAIFNGIKNIEGILSDPPPRVLIDEVSDSWIAMRVFYSINDYGMKYRKGDEVMEKILESIRSSRLPLASPTLRLLNDENDHD